MKLVVNDRDISGLYRSVEWSGDVKQRSRSITASYLYKPGSGLPEVLVSEGDTAALYDDSETMWFIGIVLKASTRLSAVTADFTARDILWYLGKNKVSKVYEGTADAIAGAVFNDFSILAGDLPSVSETKKIVSTGDKTVYQVISEAYGDGYYLRADDNRVSVVKEGTEVVAVLSGKANLTDALYEASIENMVNRVLILAEDGTVTGTVQTDSDLVYGILQDTYKAEKDKDAQIGASAVLKSTERTASVEGLGDWACVAGQSIYVMDTSNGMLGRYLITDDSHTFSGGYHKMKLGIKLEAIT